MPPSSCCCAARPGATSRSSGSRASGSWSRSARTARSRPRRRSRSEVDGERYVRTAEGNGPVNALDKALRGAITDRHPHLADIELTNYKVRILDEHHGTGAVTRVLLDSSDGEREWGTIGVSENIIEASWEALVDSLEYAFQPREPRARRRAELTTNTIPLARPGARPARGGAGAGGAALRPALAGADAGALRARVRRLARGRVTRSRSPAGRPALHLGVRALGWGEGDEVVTSPFSFVASANCLLYEGAQAGLLRRRPGDAEPRPRGGRRGGRRAHRRDPAGPHLRLPGRRWPSSSSSPREHGLGMLEDACEALGAVDAEGRKVGARGNLATFAFYANKQMTTGEGGIIVPPTPRWPRGCAQRAQPGPRRRHGLARPRPARLQLPALRPRRRDRRRPARAARRAARARAPRVAALYARAAARRRRGRRRTPMRRPRRESAAAGSSTRCGCRRGRPRRDRSPASPSAASPRKAYLPCIHLFPHLRELGYREGQFPVAEAAAARSLALPFFPAMTEAQVDRVCEALGRGARYADPHNRRSCPASAKSPTRASGGSTARSRSTGGWRPTTSTSRRRTPAALLRDRRPRRGRAGADRRRPRAGRARGWREHGFEFERRRRGHPHGDRAPARRGDRPAGRQAPHRPLAQRPGRDRRRDGRPGALAAGDRALRRGDGAAARRWPRPTATGRCPATRTCSAPSRSTSATTCSPTSGCSPATSCASSSRSTAPA